MARKLSPTQKKALAMLRLSGKLKRWPGGYWVAPTDVRSSRYGVPEPSVGTSTVEALRRLGYLAIVDGEARELPAPEARTEDRDNG